MGEHRWKFYRGAKSIAYEEAANVPMHVRGPGVAKGSNPSLVLNNDLAPTFLRMAGLTPPSYTDGRDLADVWKGANLVRKAILNERALTDDSPIPPYRSGDNRTLDLRGVGKRRAGILRPQQRPLRVGQRVRL